jgi:hypothetical protein
MSLMARADFAFIVEILHAPPRLCGKRVCEERGGARHQRAHYQDLLRKRESHGAISTDHCFIETGPEESTSST